jgi:hypothetical protein
VSISIIKYNLLKKSDVNLPIGQKIKHNIYEHEGTKNKTGKKQKPGVNSQHTYPSLPNNENY